MEKIKDLRDEKGEGGKRKGVDEKGMEREENAAETEVHGNECTCVRRINV